MAGADDLTYLAALLALPRVRVRDIYLLRTRLGSARAVWEASVAELRAGDVEQATVAAILGARSDGCRPRAPGLEAALARGFRVFSRWDACYPLRLREMPDAPLLLYALGDVLPSDEKAVAIVGSRRCTSYGLTVAQRMSRSLAAAGLTIVSGLARGIDTAAHEGALAAGGRTLAVLGSGLSRLYPAENRGLADRIARQGALLTEYPPDEPARDYHFPHRNRIIAGLSLGTLVAEAPRRSGALVTADHAASQGKPVMAVPGPITSPYSTGCNLLIRDGAHLVESPEDVLAVLGTAATAVPVAPPLDEKEERVFSLLDQAPTYEKLRRLSGMPAGELTATLLGMELKGVVRRLPGQTYIRVV